MKDWRTIQQRAKEILLEWVKEQSPDEWHKVALSWNWDNGEDIPDWIVSHPECDKATAQWCFFLAEPSWYYTYSSRKKIIEQAPHLLSNFEFLSKLIDNWNSDFYVRSEIASTPHGYWFNTNRVFKTRTITFADAPDWILRDDLFHRFTGRGLVADGYKQGVPAELQSQFDSLGISIGGWS